MNQAVVAEVEATKKSLMAGVDKEVAKAKATLFNLTVSIETAEKELTDLAEKRRKFILYLG